MISAKTQFLLIAGPFLMFIMVKASNGNWNDVFAVADWSMAAVIIFCQSFTTLVPAIVSSAKRGTNINSDALLWHLIVMIICGLIPSFYIYSEIIALPQGNPPDWKYQLAQMVMFSLASFKFFWDHRVVKKLAKLTSR